MPSEIENIKLMLGKDADFYKDDLIAIQIENAAEFINLRRGYEPQNGEIVEKKYMSLLRQMVVAAISKMGAEGESAHSEGGVNRTYGSDGIYPQSLTNAIMPLIKVVR